MKRLYKIEPYLPEYVQMSESMELFLSERPMKDHKGIRLCRSDRRESFSFKGVRMVEYHVDSHPIFRKWGVEFTSGRKHCTKCSHFNGVYSVNLDGDVSLFMLSGGQDETAVSQHHRNTHVWYGSRGQKPMFPKSEGLTFMISGHMSRAWTWITSLPQTVIDEVNLSREGKVYCSTEAAMKVYGTINKPALKIDSSDNPFLRCMLVGAANDGYFTNDHSMIQLEDLIDCLRVMYKIRIPAEGGRRCPKFVLSYDCSSGHRKTRDGALSVSNLNVNACGEGKKVRDTKLDHGVGEFEAEQGLSKGDIQVCWYDPARNEPGPFYMTPAEREENRFDRDDGPPIEKTKSKKDLVPELRIKYAADGQMIKRLPCMNVTELRALARSHNISTTYLFQKKKKGYLNRNKGMRQLCHERRLLDPSKSLTFYTANGRKDRHTGEIIPGSSLKALLEGEADFQSEVTALQALANELGAEVMYSGEGSPETAGDGIENAWAVGKMDWRSVPLVERKTKEQFLSAVKRSFSSEILTPFVVGGCVRKARCYQMSYVYLHAERVSHNRQHIHGITVDDMCLNIDPLAMGNIKKWAKYSAKTHRNNIDFSKKECKLILAEAICMERDGTLDREKGPAYKSYAKMYRRASIG